MSSVHGNPAVVREERPSEHTGDFSGYSADGRFENAR